MTKSGSLETKALERRQEAELQLLRDTFRKIEAAAKGFAKAMRLPNPGVWELELEEEIGGWITRDDTGMVFMTGMGLGDGNLVDCYRTYAHWFPRDDVERLSAKQLPESIYDIDGFRDLQAAAQSIAAACAVAIGFARTNARRSELAQAGRILNYMVEDRSVKTLGGARRFLERATLETVRLAYAATSDMDEWFAVEKEAARKGRR